MDALKSAVVEAWLLLHLLLPGPTAELAPLTELPTTILFERGASTDAGDLSDRQLRFLWHGRSLIPTGGLGKRFSLSIRS